MPKYELSKPDFDLIDEVFGVFIEDRIKHNIGVKQLKELRERFRLAHTGFLEFE